MKYTGRYRHRTMNRWFRKPLLVLQLEVVRSVATESFEMENIYSWVDATVEQIQEISSKKSHSISSRVGFFFISEISLS